MKIPNVIHIQRFSVHDGDGIRTTIFFKGCYLNCLWCHNPESQNFEPQMMVNAERCTGCGACGKVCPAHAVQMRAVDGADLESGCTESALHGAYIQSTDRSICSACGKCTDYCVNNAREIAGRQYTVQELVREVEKDYLFYEESFGGVTLSGGEVMAQDMDYIEELLKQLKRKGYHVTIDTCGYAPQKNFERVLRYTDTFLYDLKLMDSGRHKQYMGQGNEQILANLRYLNDHGARIYIRIPVIGGVNDTEEDMNAVIEYLKEGFSIAQVNLLPYHDIASSKYERLGMEYHGKDFTVPTGEQMEAFRELFWKNGFQNTKIGG